MESTLFTTLTATEEANLSGGKSYYDEKPKKPAKHKKEEPKTPVKYPVVLPKIDINVITQLNVIAGNDNDDNVQANNVG
ncbi:hypothetical protein [Nostoc favosum]|uniref:Uncharacterized protein n=1 Tax=Nostoc favosum CHAB5714 TaxID=2780399 RepID=A0ABS8IFU2_9NOSO|nr:hypothetical protein [Nostoc favosum]MCC5602958.1 hypothetical protein [Nostoc favosum CHAB5714]